MVDLAVRGTAVTTQALSCIVGCSLPQLRFLTFDRVQMNTANIEELANGNWPNLQCLIIRYSPSSEVGGQSLMRGN